MGVIFAPVIIVFTLSMGLIFVGAVSESLMNPDLQDQALAFENAM